MLVFICFSVVIVSVWSASYSMILLNLLRANLVVIWLPLLDESMLLDHCLLLWQTVLTPLQASLW